MELKSLQDVLQNKILHDHELPALIVQGHLEIYKNNTQTSCFKALKNAYTVCQDLVGSSFFKYISYEFIKENPSYYRDLNDYGDLFSSFIAKHPRTQELPYLADFARLEWAIHQALIAETSILENRGIEDLEDIEQFCLAPSVHLIKSAFPILRIWQVNQEYYIGDQTVSLDEGGVSLIIWTKAFDLYVEPVSAIEWDFLSAIASGKDIAELYEIFEEQFTIIIVKFIAKGCLHFKL